MDNQHRFVVTILDTRDNTIHEIPCDVACCFGLTDDAGEDVGCKTAIVGCSHITPAGIVISVIRALRSSESLGAELVDKAWVAELLEAAPSGGDPHE